MSFKTPTLPTLPKIKSAWKLALWMAALNISYAVLMAGFSALINKINMWRMTRNMKKFQAEMLEQQKLDKAVNDEATADA